MYITSVVLHILAAMLWVGGMGMFAAVVVPVARKTLDVNQAASLLRGVGNRLARMTPWLLGTLIVTGAINLWRRGVSFDMLGTVSFWRTSFGTVFAIKLTFVALIVGASTLHSHLARRARVGRRANGAWLGRATLVLSVVVVVLAVMLVRGF